VQSVSSTREKPDGMERVVRDITLWVKNDAFRGNFVYQGYSGIRRAVAALSRPKNTHGRVVKLAGEEFRIVPGGTQASHEGAPEEPVDEQRPSFYPVQKPRRHYGSMLQFSLNGGYSTFGNNLFSALPISLVVPLNDGAQAVFSSDLRTDLTPSWNVALKATLHPHRFISHEFGFTFSNTTLEVTATSPIASPEDLDAPAHIRQFSYTLIANGTPNGSRWRPYAAIGPALQMIRLTGGVGGGTSFPRIAFRDVGLIARTWDFGSDPPLEGGNIFQPALVYGAGFQFHATPHVLVRADVRQSLSEQPDFWKQSYSTIATRIEGVGEIVPGNVQLYGPLRHTNLTFGMGVSF
jgi:hypothetical protein